MHIYMCIYVYIYIYYNYVRMYGNQIVSIQHIFVIFKKLMKVYMYTYICPVQFPLDLVTFTQEIRNGRLHFLCSTICVHLCVYMYICEYIYIYTYIYIYIYIDAVNNLK